MPIGGTDDLPWDSVPSSAKGGISPETEAELNSKLTEFRTKVAAVNTAIGQADATKAALLSWANLAKQVMDMGSDLLGKYVAANPPAATPPSVPERNIRLELLGLIGSATAPGTTPQHVINTIAGLLAR